jgi:hypothetical protein
MFTYDGTAVVHGSTVGLYTVRLHGSNGTQYDIEVDTELPSGGQYYDHVANALGTHVLWVALAEKAYAEANSLGYVTTNHEYQDSYGALNYGDAAWALQAITGKPASDYSINPTNIAADWNAGCLIVICTPNKKLPSSYILGNHCYAVVGYNASSSLPFEVFNPYGTDALGWEPGHDGSIYGLFKANAPFISQNFSGQSIGSGAINVNNVTQPVNKLTGLATLADGYAPSGTIHLNRYSTSGSAVDKKTATPSNLSLSSRNIYVVQDGDILHEGSNSSKITGDDRLARLRL